MHAILAFFVLGLLTSAVHGQGSRYPDQGSYGRQRCVGELPAAQVESSFKTCVVTVSLDSYENYGGSGRYGNPDDYENSENYGNPGGYGNKGENGNSEKYGNYNSRYSKVKYAVDPSCPYSFLQKTTDDLYDSEYALYIYQDVAPATVFSTDVCGLVAARV